MVLPVAFKRFSACESKSRTRDSLPVDDLSLSVQSLTQRDYGVDVTQTYGDVAQLGEHCLCKAGVRGSSPLVSTFISYIDHYFLGLS